MDIISLDTSSTLYSQPSPAFRLLSQQKNKAKITNIRLAGSNFKVQQPPFLSRLDSRPNNASPPLRQSRVSTRPEARDRAHPIRYTTKPSSIALEPPSHHPCLPASLDSRQHTTTETDSPIPLLLYHTNPEQPTLLPSTDDTHPSLQYATTLFTQHPLYSYQIHPTQQHYIQNQV